MMHRLKQQCRACTRRACVVLLAIVCAAMPGCTFGDQVSSLDEDRSLNAYLLALIGTTGTGVLRLRFGDGGTDRIDEFSSAQGTVALGSSVWFDIEKIDVYAGQQDSPFPLAPATYYMDRFIDGVLDGLAPVTPLAAHEESVEPAAGVTLTVAGEDQFVQPISAGVAGNGSDSLGRAFFQTGEITVALPPGGIQQLVMHIRRMQLVGTIGGNAFSVTYTVNSDFAVTPRCNNTVTSNGTTRMDLFFDYSRLFQSLTAANSAAVNSAIAANIPAGGILGESECFIF